VGHAPNLESIAALPSTFLCIARTFRTPSHVIIDPDVSMKSCLTKIFAAAAIALVTAGVSYGFGSLVIRPQALAKNVFVVEVPQATAAAVTATSVAAAPAVASAPALPIGELLTKADADSGQKYAKVCSTCHSFNKGEAAKMGPNLYGIVGSKHAHMAGFAYSDAMKALADKPWTFDALNHFLTDPKGTVPGTKMPFTGIKSDSDCANVIAWLRTLSDKPEPFPAK
jgi:cytochrome c